MKYPSNAGIVMSVHMCAWYRGDQNGTECFPSSLAVLRTAFWNFADTYAYSGEFFACSEMKSFQKSAVLYG